MITSDIIARNLNRVREQIASAALSGNRDPQQVRLVAVTKSVEMDEIEALVQCGQHDLGENRLQQLAARQQEAAERQLEVCWHMIGHLQRRKVRDILPLVQMIHSIDSLRLAEEIQKRAGEQSHSAANGRDRRVQVLLEVNVSGEVQKQGLEPEEVAEVVGQISGMSHLRLCGLMTMAPLAAEAEEVRPVFRRLRELRDRLNDNAVYHEPLPELSMGMSQDYQVAVEEGATIVRVGSALFEED